MFDPISLSLVGAGVGALFNKKNPLEGAAMGAALGYGGSQIPGLLAEAPVAGAAASGLAPVATGVSSAGVAANALPGAAAGEVGAYNASVQGGGLLGMAKDTMQVGGNALTAANTAKNLTTQQKTPITPSPMPTPMPNTNLGQMVQASEQKQLNQMQQDQQARMMRRQRGLL